MPSLPLFSTPTPQPDLRLNPEEEAALTAFLQRLVQTPSYPTQEGEVAALVQAELHRLGISDVWRDHAGNVIARLGNGNGPTLLYDAHMDTVHPAEGDWPHPPHAAVIEDGVLYGLGACDMKGALAAMVYAAHRLIKAQAELDGTLILAFVVQEEPCEGYALRVLMEGNAIRPDWIVLGEPSGMQIKRGHRGRVLFKVTVRGRSSHGASPELGENAITGAARLIFGLDLLAADLPDDPFLGPGTVAVTHIESRSPSLNAIPDVCTLYVDRRLTLGETHTRAQAQIESVIEREGLRAEVEIAEYCAHSYTGYEFRTPEVFNAWALEESHPLIQALSAAVRAVRGQSPAIGRWSFSTDGVYSMGEAHIPTAGFGPGNPEYAHTVYESVSLRDVFDAAHIYALLAALLLGKP